MIIAIVFAISAIILFLFLICPSIRKHPDKALCKRLLVSHRGLHSLKHGIPENSIAAFVASKEKGYAIELDIHLTKDGEVAVFHDDTLERACGINSRINELTKNQLKKLSLFNTREKIPMLKEVLECIDGKVPILIEYKCGLKDFIRLCKAAERYLRNYNGKYLVQSFNPLPMLWYRLNKPKICRGQLSTNFFLKRDFNFIRIIAGMLLLNFISRPDFISYECKFSNSIQRKICVLLGAIQAGWTFKSHFEMKKKEKSFDIIIFEDFEPIK